MGTSYGGLPPATNPYEEEAKKKSYMPVGTAEGILHKPQDPRDKVFFDIIEYLNNENLQGDSRIWSTEHGLVWIYWSTRGWQGKWFGEATTWPKEEL